MSRGAVAYIDANALIHNFSRIKKMVDNRAVVAMIKSNAYGHGLLRVAKTLNVAEAFGGIAPTAIGVGVGGEPGQTALYISGVVGIGIRLHLLQGHHSGGGGEGAAGKFTGRVALSIAPGEEGLAGSVQRGLQSGGVEVHCSVPLDGLRFS